MRWRVHPMLSAQRGAAVKTVWPDAYFVTAFGPDQRGDRALRRSGRCVRIRFLLRGDAGTLPCGVVGAGHADPGGVGGWSASGFRLQEIGRLGPASSGRLSFIGLTVGADVLARSFPPVRRPVVMSNGRARRPRQRVLISRAACPSRFYASAELLVFMTVCVRMIPPQGARTCVAQGAPSPGRIEFFSASPAAGVLAMPSEPGTC